MLSARFQKGWRGQRRSFAADVASHVHELVDFGGLKLVFAVVEPIFIIGVALLWHTLMQVSAPYGTNRALFLCTGFFPVHFFVEISSDFRIVAKKGSSLRRYPAETLLDNVIVSTLVNAFLYVAAGTVGFYLLYLFETPEALPYDMSWVAVSVAEMVVLGFAVGLCNAAIEQYVPVWRDIWIGIGRGLILFSGIFYVPSFLPVMVRDIMGWNLVMQGVETLRYGIYPGYPRQCDFPGYFWSCTIALLLIGLCAHRYVRRHARRQ